MTAQKTKILLDADVIIHFFKGGKLSMLPRILPDYQFVLLDVVKREIPLIMMLELDRLITADKTVIEMPFGTSPGEIKEYARLTSSDGLALGKGESACMVYCSYQFIKKVVTLGSRLPEVDFDLYTCDKL